MGSFKILDKKQHFCGGGKEKEKNKRFLRKKEQKAGGLFSTFGFALAILQPGWRAKHAFGDGV